jgi:accessory gene regulator protein AgrB
LLLLLHALADAGVPVAGVDRFAEDDFPRELCYLFLIVHIHVVLARAQQDGIVTQAFIARLSYKAPVFLEAYAIGDVLKHSLKCLISLVIKLALYLHQ